jgi:hypothetical protein
MPLDTYQLPENHDGLMRPGLRSLIGNAESSTDSTGTYPNQCLASIACGLTRKLWTGNCQRQ